MGLLLLIVAGVLVWTFGLPRWRAAQKRKAAEAWIERVEREGLAPVHVSVSLRRGEEGYYEAPGTLHEPRATRRYEGASASFRIMKGVSLRSSRGRAISTQEWQQIDAGSVTVTSRRLIFTGSTENRSLDITKIDGVQAFGGGVRINASNRKKPFTLVVEEPAVLATMLTALQDPERYLPNT